MLAAVFKTNFFQINLKVFADFSNKIYLLSLKYFMCQMRDAKIANMKDADWSIKGLIDPRNKRICYGYAENENNNYLRYTRSTSFNNWVK